MANPSAAVRASHVERRPPSQRSLARPRPRRDAAPPGLGGGHEQPRADLVEAERLDGVERQVAQHRGLHHAEDEPGGEEDEHGGTPRPRPVGGCGLPRRRECGRGGRQRRERTPGGDHGYRDDERAGGDGAAPAVPGCHRRQDKGRGHATERQPHLLDAHGHAALVRREDVHDALAERGIDHAPADARHEQAEEEAGEGR